MARSGSVTPVSAVSVWKSDGARRLTFSPPGRMPSAAQPLSTHSRMTAQSASSFSRSSASLRHTSSLASMTSEMDMPSRRQISRSSSAVVKGYGSGVSSATTWASAPASPSTTKPPPME